MLMSESMEMYIETILELSNMGIFVRSLDVARNLGVSKPSVSRAMGILKNNELILIDSRGYITLTENGEKIAKKILEKRMVLKEILLSLGVDEKTAAEDACRIEHVLSDKTFEALKVYRSNL